METILALDQSTSATKALLFGVDGRLLDSESLPHAQHYPRPGWVEHDAEELYQNALRVLRAVLARAASRPVCLSLTNQRETVVVFERGTGRPLYRAIVWQCRRGDPICQALLGAGHGELVRQRTGLKIDTYFPAPKLAWLFEAEPALARRVRAGEALIGTIDAYLIYRLTAGRVFASDATNASRTLLLDIHTLQWDAELCALFGVPPGALPEVRDSSARYGETDLEGLLAAPLPICGVMGDSQAALLAERCLAPGSAKVTLGTGSSVLLNIGAAPRPARGGSVTSVAWVLQGQPTYALEGIINYTGATVAWLRDGLALIGSAAESEDLAQAVPDNGGVYLVPAFVGLSAPWWRADTQAAILGLTPASRREHVVRAALESIAYQIRDVLDEMALDAGAPAARLHADGGAVRNRFLVQCIADLTRLPVRASSLPELSALGAVFAGALGMGVYRSAVDLASLAMDYVDYQPLLAAEVAERYYVGWRAAVRRVL